MRMKRRTTVHIITFLSAALLTAGVFAIKNTRKAHALELYARANTQHAFDELVTSMSELSTALDKCVYLSDPALESALCTQIFGRAMTAQMAMGALPYASQELEQTASFVAKVGDYACTLARTVGGAGGYSQEELENLRSLADTADVMRLNLQDVQQRIMTGALTMEEVYASGAAAEEEGQPPLAGTAFQTIEREFPEMPTLIYDGPFSESMAEQKGLFLEGMEQVDKEEAVKAAARFLEADAADLAVTDECEGDIPRWVVSGRVDGCEYTLHVTKQGGQIWSVLCPRAVEKQSYSIRQGLATAKKFVERWGLKGMEESYHTVSDGVLLVNYQYCQDGVRCYPDLIKVGVALDTGSLMSYDAQGYINAHHERDIPAVKVSREQAQSAISDSLTVKEHAMAIIPSQGGEERLCHEFLCQSEAGEKYLLYVNALTGGEEKILILLEDDTGTLTI